MTACAWPYAHSWEAMFLIYWMCIATYVSKRRINTAGNTSSSKSHRLHASRSACSLPVYGLHSLHGDFMIDKWNDTIHQASHPKQQCSLRSTSSICSKGNMHCSMHRLAVKSGQVLSSKAHPADTVGAYCIEGLRKVIFVDSSATCWGKICS